jgi:hypothetical protein
MWHATPEFGALPKLTNITSQETLIFKVYTENNNNYNKITSCTIMNIGSFKHFHCPPGYDNMWCGTEVSPFQRNIMPPS